MNFEWDERKNTENTKKHGVTFEEAVGVFYDSYGLDQYDESHSSADEERFLRIGHSSKGRLLIVAYTERKDATRIISARKVKPNEKKSYSPHTSP